MEGVSAAGVKVSVTGVCRDGLCEKRPWAALHWTQMVPAGFKMDPPQDTAESISQAGVTSVKTYLRAESATGIEGNKKE